MQRSVDVTHLDPPGDAYARNDVIGEPPSSDGDCHDSGAAPEAAPTTRWVGASGVVIGLDGLSMVENGYSVSLGGFSTSVAPKPTPVHPTGLGHDTSVNSAKVATLAPAATWSTMPIELHVPLVKVAAIGHRPGSRTQTACQPLRRASRSSSQWT